METTTNYGLKKPGQDEFYDVGDFNDNMDKIDAELKKCSEAAGNPMEAVTEFTPATDRENIKSGEKLGTALGKIAKFLADLKAAAFKSVANNLTTTEEGSVLDARQGAVLQKEIDQVNSDLGNLPHIEYGVASVTGSSVTLYGEVTFTNQFKEVPVILLTSKNDVQIVAHAGTATVSGFKFTVRDIQGSTLQSAKVNWLAIG